jgi:hypothetical protein
LIIGGVLGHPFNLVARNVAADGFAVFPALEVVVRPGGALANDTEFARLHGLDLSNFTKDLSGVRLFHGQSIYLSIYFATKKLNILAAFLNGDLRPDLSA